jgi:hypothetical protein
VKAWRGAPLRAFTANGRVEDDRVFALDDLAVVARAMGVNVVASELATAA